ncbi:MAG: HTTM domain-containing protein [Natronomonas sp.]
MSNRFPRLGAYIRHVGGYLTDCIRIDTRSLAVFRVLVGLLVVADVILRSRNFLLYYTDDGVVPEALAREHTSEYAVSVFYLSSEPSIIAVLFLAGLLLALCLIVGYRTRTVTALTFLFVVSLDHHNPFVLSYSDTLFRLLLFWALFLPLGERWSVDAVHTDREPRRSVAGLATFLALGQMVFMYFLNGVHKTESELWRSGEATPLIFGIDEMTFLLGEVLGAFPTLLTYGGLLWFYMLLGSWLLFVLRGRLRLLLVALFFGGHLAFALTVRIGAFAYVAMAGLVLFLQAPFWRDSHRLARCLGVDPWTIVPRKTAYEAAAVFPPVRILPARYDGLKRTADGLTRGLLVLGLVLILVVFLLNPGPIVTDGYDQHRLNHEVAETTGGDHLYAVAEGLGVTQPEWSVFAPHPRTTDRYYVFGAVTADGDRLDVFNDRPFTWDRPGRLQNQHDTYRERFFMNSVRRAGASGELPTHLAEHICTVYEDEHGIELSHISMFEVTEDITSETITDPTERETDRNHFHRHTCRG